MTERNPMFDPPHPGDFITETYLIPLGMSARTLAEKLDVTPSTVSRVLSGASRVSPDMALRLAKALGRSAESWLAMQDAYDLWNARQTANLGKVKPIDLSAA